MKYYCYVNKVLTNSKFVEEVILKIYSNQTQDEQQLQNTYHKNGIGFRSNHAKKGSKLAELILSGQSLQGTDLLEGQLISLSYHNQFNKIT